MSELDSKQISTWHDEDGLEVLVIDQAFESLEALRAQMRATCLESKPMGDIECWKACAAPVGNRALAQEIATCFVNHRWGDSWPSAISVSCPKVTTDFAVMRARQEEVSEHLLMHDSKEHWLSCVLFIESDNSAGSGIFFWRHKASGLQCWSDDPDAVRSFWREQFLNLSFRAQVERALETNPSVTQDELLDNLLASAPWKKDSGWELLLQVPTKANRLVCYPTWQFSSQRAVAGSTNAVMNMKVSYPWKWKDKPREEAPDWTRVSP